MGKLIIENILSITESFVSIPKPDNINGLPVNGWIVRINKKGFMCFLFCEINMSNIPKNQDMIAFTLPEGYRPINYLIRNHVAQDGSIMVTTINTDGVFKFTRLSEPLTELTGWTAPVRQDFCYITQ